MKIETERLILRKLKKSDAIAMHHYARKPDVGPNAGWAMHQSLEETKMILNMMIAEDEVLAITIKPHDVMVGTIGLHARKAVFSITKTRELGYALDSDYWYQGYMTEAASAMLQYGFQKMRLKRVICGHEITNLRSKRVIEKLGFVYYGTEIRKNYLNEDASIWMYELKKEQL